MATKPTKRTSTKSTKRTSKSHSPATTNKVSRTNVSKYYLLDTNVLLHDAQSIFKFKDNHVLIPVQVMEELDHKKGDLGQVGYNARSVNRTLRNIFSRHKRQDSDSNGFIITSDLPGGGKISMVTTSSDYVTKAKYRNTLRDTSKTDNHILDCALSISNYALDVGRKLILVTKDANMHLKALATDLTVEDYLNDRVEDSQSEHYDTISTRLLHKDEETGYYTANIDVPINTYLVLKPAHGEVVAVRSLGHSDGITSFKPVTLSKIVAQGMRPIVPKNVEQAIFYDALSDPSIPLVTCMGKAGTGKTLVAIAAALSQATGSRPKYSSIRISRPLISLGKDPGALPGDKDEKVMPYLQSFFDNLEVLFHSTQDQFNPLSFTGQNSSQKSKQAAAKAPTQPRKPYQYLLDSGLMEIEVMSFIRGRSLAGSFMIMDESQNLTPHEAKTVITRIGEGSKMVLIGDPSQVDVPTLDAHSNGLTYTHKVFTGSPLAARVFLTESVRSALAEEAARLM